MLTLIYGLKDAPRVWRQKLHQVLDQWMSCQQLCSELELHCVHKRNQRSIMDAIAMATQHDSEQQGSSETRNVLPQECKPGNLRCLLAVHVDDTSGMAPKVVADLLLKHLNDSVGRCKADWGSFLHTGVQCEHSPGSVFTHQCVYVDSIRPIDTTMLGCKGDGGPCGDELHEAYRSVLGAVALTVLARAELAVYVQALQTRAHAPRVRDCKRLSLVIRYLENTNCGLKIVALKRPLKLVGFTDVAFKVQPGEPTGLALRGLAAIHQEDTQGND